MMVLFDDYNKIGTAFHENVNTRQPFQQGSIIVFFFIYNQEFDLDIEKRTLDYSVDGVEVLFTHVNIIPPVHIAFCGGKGSVAIIL